MKIQSIHFHNVGPLGDRVIDFTSDWDGQIEKQILLSGPNGCGKSTVLRTIALLWEALEYWLAQRKPLPKNHHAREWLQRWGGCAVVLDGAPAGDPLVGLVFGDLQWCVQLKSGMPGVQWVGEGVARTGKPGNPKRELFLPEGDGFSQWSDASKRMSLTFEPIGVPNITFMDGEERRWVTPKKRVGEFLAESPKLRWLPRYLPTEDWEGQLEASLINLKLTNEEKFEQVLEHLNAFLFDKHIEPDIPEGSNRLRVKFKEARKGVITLDELSAGEHQVLIMIYLVARWAEPGGVVMIDEPDLHLHPSLTSMLLARLETMVQKLNGQLLITSHVPSVWSRYETTGRRIELGVSA
jgi:ABC-type lipoprotein export system ATPase subunit